MRGFGRRFAAEVGFIVLVAVGLAVANLRWPAIVLLMAAAWVLTAFVEFVAWRRGRPARAVGPAVAEPQAQPEPTPQPAARDSHVRVLTEPAPPEVAPQPVEEEPIERAPEPEPLPPPEPEPEPELPPAAETAPTAGPRTWNVWELERAARELPGDDVARREELAYLLVYLRDFASPEGELPTDFDDLVRESFGELLAAGAAS
jgi:outer membrane biosynthesis protein TonB